MRTWLILIAFLTTAASGATACPDEEEYGEIRMFTGKGLYYGRQFSVTAGGHESLSDCGIQNTGPGHVAPSPDFSFVIQNMGGYELMISVIGKCDTVLLINTPTEEWIFNDEADFVGDAGILLQEPPAGWLDIWVGAYEDGFCDAVLHLETTEMQ